MTSRRVFFLMAAVFASIAPWLLVLNLSGFIDIGYGVVEHAHAMLYGFVGALIVGYLLGKCSVGELMILVAIWLLGRILETFTSYDAVTYIFYALFGMVVAYPIATKFLAAKKITHMLVLPILMLIGGFPIFDYIIGRTIDDSLNLEVLILLITTLLFFMGGRVITPSLAKAMKSSYKPVAHRVQPQLELLAMVLLLTLAVLAVSNIFTQTKAIIALIIAILIFIRVIRWQPYKVNLKHGHIWAFLSGYSMLGIGLTAYAVDLYNQSVTTSSFHIITIGALGTLSTSIMMKASYGRNRLANSFFYITSSLLIASAITRFIVDIGFFNPVHLLVLSSALWTLSYIVTAVALLKVPRKQ